MDTGIERPDSSEVPIVEAAGVSELSRGEWISVIAGVDAAGSVIPIGVMDDSL